MGFTCPNCGGNVLYDIPNKNLRCQNCGSTFEVTDFRLTDTKEAVRDAGTAGSASAEESPASGTEGASGGSRDAFTGARQQPHGGNGGFVRYVCRNCGAEINSLDTDLVAYCQYCGGEVVLEDAADAAGDGEKPASGADPARASASRRIPEKIIPFSLTKQQAIDRYQKFLKSCHYLPEEYKDPDFLQNFTGIYIPEWTYQTSYDGSVPFTFEANRQISYDWGEMIRGTGRTSLSGYVEESKDASARLDDNIAAAILPANMTGMVPFYPGYMAGFYADAPSVPAETYSDLVLSHADEFAQQKMTVAAEQQCGGSASVQIDRSQMPEPQVSVESSLMPVWFLTWKKGDRVAYSVMNGQTGDCYADMPVSQRAFLKASLITAAVVAAILLILTHFVLLTPDALLYLSLYLCVISADLYRSEISGIACRENHVYDRGYKGETRMKQEKIDRLRGRSQSTGMTEHLVWFLLMTLIAFVPLILAVHSHVVDRGMLITGTLLLWIATVRKAVQIGLWAKDTSHPAFGWGGALLQVLPFLGLMVQSIEQNDLPFYLLTMAVLAVLILQVLLLTRYYNLLATRPVPGFHTGRQGGNDGRS